MPERVPRRTQPCRGAMTVSCLVAGLWLAGCASAPTAREAPAAVVHAPVPAVWQAPLPHEGRAADLLAWWGQFGDPELVALIEAAQKVSPTLATAASRIDQARAARVAAGGQAQPQVDGFGALSRGRSEPGGALANVVNAGLQASWEIDLFGAVRAGTQASQARLEGAQAAWHAARVSVAAEVASAYLSLRACEALVGELETDVASRGETARVTERSAQAGLSAPAAAAQARASAAQGRTQLVSQRAQCDSLVKALVALSATEEPDLRQRLAARSARLPVAAPFAIDSLPGQLLEQRPDLAEAAAAVTAAAADVQLAEARRYPRVSLGGSLGGMAIRAEGVRRDGATWSLGPLQVSFPVFDAGVRRANVQAARGAYDESVALYQARLRQAVREVEDALVQLRSAADRQADARLAAEGYEASFRAAEARFKGGVASIFELEDARRTAIAARSALLDWQRDRTAAWISLYRALGGGWQSAGPAPTAAAATP